MKKDDKPEIGMSKERKRMHYSIGALIKQNGKYLLIDRKIEPMGFAAVAGHVDKGETPMEALIREVKEETGLKVVKADLIHEEEYQGVKCSYGVDTHYWYVYNAIVTGKPKRSKEETKSLGFYSVSEMKKLELEASWRYLFCRLGIL